MRPGNLLARRISPKSGQRANLATLGEYQASQDPNLKRNLKYLHIEFRSREDREGFERKFEQTKRFYGNEIARYYGYREMSQKKKDHLGNTCFETHSGSIASMATRSVASLVVEALESFNAFVDLLEALEPRNRRLLGVSVTGWKDELGRLRIWAANVGTHETYQMSLDYRLRDAPHIFDQVVELLADLAKRLDDAEEVFMEILGRAVDQVVISDQGDDENDVDEAIPEMEQMRGSVATIIGNLFQMSMLIQKPARHYPRGSAWSDVATFEDFDIDHLKILFPKASPVLVMRLGNALTRRRMYLRYREKHAAISKQGLDQTEDRDRVIMLDTVINKSPAHHDILFDDQASNAQISKIWYTPALGSSGIALMPSPPAASADKRPFECPLCHSTIVLETHDSWAEHVFHDLEPYICLNIDCVTPQKLYASEGEWLHHMASFHPTDADQAAETQQHPRLCPLCCSEYWNTGSYDKHVAHHLRELALFVLPRDKADPDGLAFGMPPLPVRIPPSR